MYFFTSCCQTCVIRGINSFGLQHKLEVHLGFGFGCEFTDILAAVVDQPLTRRLQKSCSVWEMVLRIRAFLFYVTVCGAANSSIALVHFNLADNLRFANKIW